MCKCPKCEKTITQLEAEVIPAHLRGGKIIEGAVFMCPLCHTILGAGLDPVTLTNQIITAVQNVAKAGSRN